MVRKVKAVDNSNSHFAAAVRDSATQIWVTGMGAFAKVQQESTKVLEALAKDGTVIQQRAKAASQDAVDQFKDQVAKVATTVAKQANIARDRFEVALEERAQRALGRLGVRSATVADLNKRVEELTIAVNKLSRDRATPAKRARKSAAA